MLNAAQLGAYFSLIESSSLLKQTVEQQLRDAGDVSFIQFQLLGNLGDAPGGTRRMTDLADDVLYSRSGMTYQVLTLEKRELMLRSQAPDDDRGVVVTLKDDGKALLGRSFPAMWRC